MDDLEIIRKKLIACGDENNDCTEALESLERIEREYNEMLENIE